jgi:RNA polymerase II-associated factor 1
VRFTSNIQVAKLVENKLKRETPFVAKIKFRNELPDLPCDPKMLMARLDTQKLAQFKLTHMELALRPDVVGAQEPCNLSLIDAQRYCVASTAPELDPEDRAIIEGNKSMRSRGDVTWLMRTK